MKEPNKAKRKTAKEQDLEDTLSFYSEALTKKVVGQLFDEYVKDDEDSFYTKTSHRVEYYDNDNDYYKYFLDGTARDSYDSGNSDGSGGFYFGNTFSNFSKENLLPDNENFTNSDYGKNDDYKDFVLGDDIFEESDGGDEENEKNEDDDREITPISKKKKDREKKNEYFEYDDFDDDFDEYDYEPKKAKKRGLIKIKPKKHVEIGEYEDFLDKKKKEKESAEKKAKTEDKKAAAKKVKNQEKSVRLKENKLKDDPAKETEYNIFIKDLTVSGKDGEKIFMQNLPPLKKNVPQRDLGYEDVLRYSPRRRGGRNQAVKKKKRVRMSDNKNIYPDGAPARTPKRAKQTPKSKIVVHNHKTKKRKSKLSFLKNLFIFILIGALIFCAVKIKSLSDEVDLLNELINAPNQNTHENDYSQDPNESPI